MAREINLVPDIKYDMIKALKLRNFIFFLCIVVSASVVVITIILGTTKVGLDNTIKSKQKTIENMSNKISEYSDLNKFLTIKNQVDDLNVISENKNVLSRVFNILSAIIPTGADTIRISEMNVNLAEDEPTISFEAQADAGEAPYIDYNVLDSFKKSMPYIHYDYGRYVDAKNNEIPAYCMIETDMDGSILKEENNIYAYWQINLDGCDEQKTGVKNVTEDFNGAEVVRIWRTPQISEWVKSGNMENNGSISGVAHFESKCVTYVGVKLSDGSTKWSPNYSESCRLVPTPEGSDDDMAGINITESSNGRASDNNLVLRFSATITLSSEFFKFNNYHMIAVGPTERRNVTDSYSQIQNMFGERAADCAYNDTVCKNGDS